MRSGQRLLYVSFAAVLATACASGPPPATEFPAGAKAPSAAEVTNLLRGKSFVAGGVRTDYAKEGNGATVYISGQPDAGTAPTRACPACLDGFRALPTMCTNALLVASDIYVKRANGQVVQSVPR